MLFNEHVEAISLDPQGLDLTWLQTTRSSPDRIPVHRFKHLGPLEEWFCDSILPQVPIRIRQYLEGLKLRGDSWDFSSLTSPRDPQFWHFDFPNERYTHTFQALFVLGGDASTDVLDPIRAETPKDLTTLLGQKPEAFSYQSYPVGTFIYSGAPFVHRRGTLMKPCHRYAFDLAHVYSD